MRSRWRPGGANHPGGQVIAHSDHGAQYGSWLFGQRLRQAGLLGSMGSIGDCFDNSVAEAFFSILQRELLDQHDWTSRDKLAAAIFEWIECWYNPSRRHSYNDGLSPLDYETALELVRDQALDGLSIGFEIVRDRWSPDRSIRTQLEVKLNEISLIGFPAYEAARVEAVRQATTPHLHAARRRLLELRK